MLGSFSTALAYRVPKKMPWARTRSKCPSCEHVLGVLDLVPIFSWLLAGRKCRHCREPISWRYPLTEAVTFFLCMGAYFIYGFTIELAFILLAIPFLMALFVIDLYHMILPNQLNLILGTLGLTRVIYFISQDQHFNESSIALNYIGGAFLFALVPLVIKVLYEKFKQKNAMGMGDIKFFFVAGLWLGAAVLPQYMIMSGVLAIILGVFWQIIFDQKRFPFGPALVMSFYVMLLFQGSNIL